MPHNAQRSALGRVNLHGQAGASWLKVTKSKIKVTIPPA